MIEALDRFFAVLVSYAWGPPQVILLIGGGLYLSVISRLLPLTQARHAIRILFGKYSQDQDPGELSHFQALSTALAATIGVGNIGGVAIAITQGGAGAVFWMWVAALVGMTTKFFTCTLAQLYRQKNRAGIPQGGPMHYIEEGLGKRFKPLAVMFASFGLVGCLPMFQTNQLAEILEGEYGMPPLWTGIAATGLVALVAFGGVERIGQVTSKAVPSMCLLYLVLAALVVIARIEMVPQVFAQIFTEAFTGRAAAGGVAGITFQQVVMIGVRRAAFSNEAGIGTAPMAHGAAKTKEPVREGLVAMLGPFIDTIVVCSLTAFVILVGANAGSEVQGVSLTAEAFASTLGPWSTTALALVVTLFALSTMISYSYYGKKCFSYLFGEERREIYTWIYLAGLFFGAIWSAEMVINIIDSAFALMALPNMIATLILAPRVVRVTRDYLTRQKAAEAGEPGDSARSPAR